jgi:short-subunit dehydrogenase
MDTLTDRVVIVTGAGSGIGAALAEAFSDRGARLTLTARRAERLAETARSCRAETLIVAADLLHAEDRRRIVQETLDRWGRIDILVNNAGAGMYGSFADAAEADWRRLFEINVFAPVFLTRAVLPAMLSAGSGLVVNVASIAGLIAHSDKVTPYVASKHALVGFSRGLAKDLAGTGVRVLAVCPHLTDTEFFKVAPGAREMAPLLARFRDFLDTPRDVARGVVEQLDSDTLIVFPTAKPARAYAKQRDPIPEAAANP